MSFDVKRVQYFNFTVGDRAGDASKLLSQVAGFGISLLAFKAVSIGTGRTQFTLFPNDVNRLTDGSNKAGLELDGPHSALLIEGGDKSGALADIFDKLSRAGITVDESSGIADIHGGYGVVLYLSQEDCERAAAALRT